MTGGGGQCPRLHLHQQLPRQTTAMLPPGKNGCVHVPVVETVGLWFGNIAVAVL